MMRVLAPLATIAAVAASVPTFPADYYTGIENIMVSNQGGYVGPGQKQCCAKGTPGCKVQTQSGGSDNYVQGTKSRWVQRGQGVLLTWAQPVHKMMALEPGSAKNSSHAWVCGLYCPFKLNYTNQAAIAPEGEHVDDLGQMKVTQPASIGGATKMTTAYKWLLKLLHLVPMATNIEYVDESGAKPVPFLLTTILTPFGGPPAVRSNQSYVGFDAAAVFDPTTFDVDMDSVGSCKRQEHGKCPGDPKPPHPPAADELDLGQLDPTRYFAKTLEEVATDKFHAMSDSERDAAKVALAAAAEADGARAAAGSGPTFAPSYIAEETSSFLIAQGNDAGTTCCSEGAPRCQIQMQNTDVLRYVDYTNKRVRAEFDSKIVIDDFVSGKVMMVNFTGGVETCASYCPIPKGEELRTLQLPNGTKDEGSAIWGGKPVEHFQWASKIFKVITMSTTDFYADTSVAGAAVPVFLSEALTPMGEAQIGTRNTTWKSFKTGVPPAAKFDIAGVDTCPIGQCSSDAYQSARLINGRVRSFEHYQPSI